MRFYSDLLLKLTQFWQTAILAPQCPLLHHQSSLRDPNNRFFYLSPREPRLGECQQTCFIKCSFCSWVCCLVCLFFVLLLLVWSGCLLFFSMDRDGCWTCTGPIPVHFCGPHTWWRLFVCINKLIYRFYATCNWTCGTTWRKPWLSPGRSTRSSFKLGCKS